MDFLPTDQPLRIRKWIDTSKLNLSFMLRYCLQLDHEDPKVVELIDNACRRINWRFESSRAGFICFLEANLDKVDWFELSSNYAAIHLLEANPDRINWYWFSQNPAIFELNAPLYMQRLRETVDHVARAS